MAILLLGVSGLSVWGALSATRQAEERIAKQVRSVTHTLSGSSIALTPRILEQMKGLSGADYLLIGPDDSRTNTLGPADIDLPPAVLNQPVADDEQLGPSIEIREGVIAVGACRNGAAGTCSFSIPRSR